MVGVELGEKVGEDDNVKVSGNGGEKLPAIHARPKVERDSACLLTVRLSRRPSNGDDNDNDDPEDESDFFFLCSSAEGSSTLALSSISVTKRAGDKEMNKGR